MADTELNANPERILVLGGDGYVGWPLTVALSRAHAEAQILVVDNLSRRRWVQEVGGNSITPIVPIDQRIRWLADANGRQGIHWIDADVASAQIDTIVADFRPDLVYHLAQQCSAPFAMSDVEQAVETVQNNEIGNLRLLWAVRHHVPDAHVVKLGTFGEYAKGGIDVAEGYFVPTWRGREASRPLPFPREADDIYHITKINDSNFVSMACRKWGLRVTDVMQSTIFGLATGRPGDPPHLVTRLDYDGVFGTVVNRFVAQVAVGLPMTVYGTGLQRTGLMALDDALASLVRLGSRRPEAGRHEVINHVTERNHCINDIAELVAEIARSRGFDPTIANGTHNPRNENDAEKAVYDVDNAYVASFVAHTPFETALIVAFDWVIRHRERINPALFPPSVLWAS